MKAPFKNEAPTVIRAAPPQAFALPAYAELHCRSNFSFLVGASRPEELVARAIELGYSGLAITDECSVAGVVRAHEAVKQQRDLARQNGQTLPFKLVLGASFEVQGEDASGADPRATPSCRLVMLARNREGWGDLCELITRARLRADKGSYRLGVRDLDTHAPTARCPDLHVLLVPSAAALDLARQAQWLAQHFAHPGVLMEPLLQGHDAEHAQRVLAAAREAGGLPVVAAGDVLMHKRSRKAVQDTLTAIRLRTPVAECGWALAPNAEQHLRSRLRLSKLHRPEWLQATQAIAQDCQFSLDEVGYEYPQEIVPPGLTAIQHLRAITAQGAARHFPQGVPASVQTQIERELHLVEELRYEAFFLTVEDIVRHARSQGILCQGRGSAANSAVCYCLGITAVNPMDTTLLFERFISRERNEPPDIDVDFEHERREEVIQYIYTKYGVDRTALAAALATYRTRSTVRDVGRALALDDSQIDAVARSVHWFDAAEDRLRQGLKDAGLDPDAPVVRQWMTLVDAIRGFPRHLSQHTGGFVIARGKLSRLVPIENAAMENRRVIQWDKDDLESLGLLKVDVLALGMLSAIRRTLNLMNDWHGRVGAARWALHDIPQGDVATYDMVCRADTVGVFQVESRAQMSMLPRLKPRCLYDLVIEVAIVRPGPIQGGMVHPYLKQRERRLQGLPLELPNPALEPALARTLGVPIFQEQVMQICMIAAGFTPGQADQLRRAMAAWRKTGDVKKFKEPILQGMAKNGYTPEFAEAIFSQICGFGEYGFPESHAYSFALLAYVSAWLKCHEPAAFLAALLNAQPMGFYAPSQLVQDAQRHGVVVLPVDVTQSDPDSSLVPVASLASTPTPAVRLGLHLVASFPREAALRIHHARQRQPFQSLDDLARRAQLSAHELQALAQADALGALTGHRRQQLWAASGQTPTTALLHDAPIVEARHERPALAEAAEGEAIVLDYAATGLTLRRHPLALLRASLQKKGWLSAEQLARRPNQSAARACGIVTMRQQPETAKGVIFVTLEDETGSVNVIVWRHVREAQRAALLRARLLGVRGEWQRSDEGVTHLIAKQLVDMTPWLGTLSTHSRDFH